MIIIEITPEHLPAMEDLYRRSVQANTRGFVQNLRFHGDIKQFAQTIHVQNGSFAIGIENGCVIAMGALRRHHDDNTKAEMCKLHVDATYQGKGYGRQMCHYFFERAKSMGLSCVDLHVTTSQCPAIKLYQTLGFEDSHTTVWESEFENEKLCFETLYMHKNLI
jgi:ribosomal protein S18 acetylase RimI-like enzyme